MKTVHIILIALACAVIGYGVYRFAMNKVIPALVIAQAISRIPVPGE